MVQHQKMLHFVSNSPWSDQAVLTKSLEMVLPEIERHGPIKVWIIDDTGFPKQGEHILPSLILNALMHTLCSIPDGAERE